MDPNDRRRDARMRISLPAVVVRRSGLEPVTMVDASYRGLFVRMSHPPPVRELIKLRIELPTGEMEAHAVVVRIVSGEPGRFGVGLRFFAFNGHDKNEWESFISATLLAQRAA